LNGKCNCALLEQQCTVSPLCLDLFAIDPNLLFAIDTDGGNCGSFVVFGHPLSSIGCGVCGGLRARGSGCLVKTSLGIFGLALGDIAPLQLGGLGAAGVFELLAVFGTDG